MFSSTQAVESFFRVLKLYQAQQFGSRLPSLHELVPAIGKAIDDQFGARQRLVQNKRIQYHHPDRQMQQVLEEASWELNPTGMRVLYDQINMFVKRRANMSVTADGKIKEVYQTGENNFDTDDKTCSCSAFAQLFFCRHLIYYRISNKLVLFNKEAFHSSLL